MNKTTLGLGALLMTAIIPMAMAQTQKTRLKWIEVQASTAEERTDLGTLGFEPTEILSDKVFFPGTDQDAEQLKQNGFNTRTHELKSEWLKPQQTPNEEKYQSYESVQKRLNDWAQKFPKIATIGSLGKSVENRTIPFIRISGLSPLDAEVALTPASFFTGCHHAREYMSVAVPMKFAEYLLDNYGKLDFVTKLVDTREIYIVPIVNPDGYVFDFGESGDKKMWRKNRAKVGLNIFGVDLNRNYGWAWGGPGASPNPKAQTYRGPSAFSEPETQAIRDFLRSKPRVKTLLSFHSFSELVLYPWGGSEAPIGEDQGDPKDLPIFKKMAEDMAAWNNYTPQQSSDLYVASGDTVDWAYGELGIYGFTFELSPRSMLGGGFYPDPSLIPVAFEDNLKPLLYLLEYSDDPSRVLREKISSFSDTPARRGVPIASYLDLKF